MLRYQLLLPPDIVDRDEFIGFWNRGPSQHPTGGGEQGQTAPAVRRRHGVRAAVRTGRTLELTGSVAAEGYLGRQPGPRHRPPRNGENRRRPISATGLSDKALPHWGARNGRTCPHPGRIHHDWLRPYLEKNASRYHIWGGRPAARACGLPKGRAAPAFPGTQVRNGGAARVASIRITSNSSWYAIWTSRCLDISPHDGAFLDQRYSPNSRTDGAQHRRHRNRLHRVRLSPATVQVSAPSVEALLGGGTCWPATSARRPCWQHHHRRRTRRRRCVLTRCPGSLHRAPAPTTSTIACTTPPG